MTDLKVPHGMSPAQLEAVTHMVTQITDIMANMALELAATPSAKQIDGKTALTMFAVSVKSINSELMGQVAKHFTSH